MTTKRITSDNWFIKRIMKLTYFERKVMNSAKHAQHTERTALTLFEHIHLPPQPHCLEIGCGQGVVTRLLVERYGAQVVASDYDPAQVAVAQERLANMDGQIEFRIVDAREIPFEDATFDAVFSFGVLHHILNGWRQAVAEIARVLKPSRWFVFTDIVVSPRTDRLVRRLFSWLNQLEETTLHASLAENSLHLEHYECSQGIMGYCTAVACKQ